MEPTVFDFVEEIIQWYVWLLLNLN